MTLRALFERIARRFRRQGSPNIQFGAIIRDSTLGFCSYIGPECRVFQADIGAFVSVGPRVIIGETEHILEHDFLSNSLLTNAERVSYDTNRAHRTVLEADCWVGAGAVIRKGVSIGHGAVVGAGAVVIRDVPPYAIVGGVPARLIRMRLDEARRSMLDATRWWRMPPERLLALREAGELISPSENSENGQ